MATTRDTPPSFSDWLTTTTRALGYARDSDLARALEIDQSIVSRWRKGSQPSVKHLDRISDLTGTQLEPLLVLAGYLHPTRARHGKTLPPPAIDAGERMIRDAPIRDYQRAPYFEYWKRRRGEEHARLARLLVGASLLHHDDDYEASSAVLANAGKSDLSAHIVGLYKGLAAASNAQADRYQHMADEKLRAAAELADWLDEIAETVVAKLEAAGASKEDIAELRQAISATIDGPWRRGGDDGEGQEGADAGQP